MSLIGKELRTALARASFSVEELRLLDRKDRQGTLSEFDHQPIVVQELNPEQFEGLDAVVVCGAADLAREALDEMTGRGLPVFDLTGQVAPSSPARVVGPHSDGVDAPGLIRVANPASILIARIVAAAGTVGSVIAHSTCVFEPAAVYGDGGIDELHEQTVEVLSFRSPPTAVLGTRIAFDVVPGDPEVEARIALDTVALLGSDGQGGSVSVVRVPTFLGLGVLVTLQGSGLGGDELLEAIQAAELLHEPANPTPGDLSDEVDPLRARFSRLPAQGGQDGARIWAVCDWIQHGKVMPALARLQRVAESRSAG